MGRKLYAPTKYLLGVIRRANFLTRESLREVTLLDIICLAIVTAAIVYAIWKPSTIGGFAREVVGTREAYQMLRGIIVALGVLILVDRRTHTVLGKIGVTLIIVGLTSNIAENGFLLHPDPDKAMPLKAGFFLANVGILVLFLSILFRYPWHKRAARLEQQLGEAQAQGFRPN